MIREVEMKMVVDDGCKRRKIDSGEDDLSIPHDLVLNILLSVPPRSLFGFRRVCKSWLSSITSQSFIAAHTQGAPPTAPLLVFFSKFQPENRRELYFYHCGSGTTKKLVLDKYLRRIGQIPYLKYWMRFLSINGLLQLNSRNSTCLFNPLTREILKLPPPPDRIGRTTMGLLMDTSTCKYHVVRLIIDRDGLLYICEIFTQGSQCWIEADSRPPPVSLLDVDPVSLKGVLYWITYGYANSNQPPHGSILSFDLDRVSNDQFELLRPPSPLSDMSKFTAKIEVLQATLCVVDYGEDIVDIWKLKEGGENEWKKWYSIHIQIPPESPWFGITFAVRVLAIHEGMIWLATVKGLFSYDSGSERLLTVSKNKGRKKILVGAVFIEGAMYLETLALVR